MLALVFALCAVVVWAAAFHVGPVHDADAALLWLARRLNDTPVESFTEAAVQLIHPIVYATLCSALLAWGWHKRGLRMAGAAGLTILGANATTQLLKAGLAEPRFHEMLDRQIDAASWPSGHATGAAVLAFAVYALFPATWRLGIAFALLIGVSVVVNDWHYPSDALGGFLVAGSWAAALLRLKRPAATTARRRRWLRATG